MESQESDKVLTPEIQNKSNEYVKKRKDKKKLKVNKAKAEKKPIFLMLTATCCGPCKSLESKTLPDPVIRGALQDFIWVKAYEDKQLDERFGRGGYPTLVFIDAETEKPFFKTFGYEAVGPFLSKIIAARKKGGLKLSEDLQKLSDKVFEPDQKKIQAMEKSGDADGLP